MQASSRLLLSAGALLGVSGVVLGAFGSHGLHGTPAQLASWSTAVQYQLLHAITIMVIALWHHILPNRRLPVAGYLLALGVVLFSGSIFALVLSGLSWLGPITPLGGVSMITGWIMLVWTAWSDAD